MFLQKNDSLGERGDLRFISFFGSKLLLLEVSGVLKIQSNIQDGESSMFDRVLNTPLDVVAARGPAEKIVGSECRREYTGKCDMES